MTAGNKLRILILSFVTGIIMMSSSALAQGVKFPTEKYVDATICGDCHGEAMEIWLNTKHAASEDMKKNPLAGEFADQLGIKSSKIKKTDSMCASCHYTPGLSASGRERVVAGVSCQSCHGAAADWVEIHNDYGGPGINRRTEDATHKKIRFQKMHEGGMVYPADLYGLATNCVTCHFVTNEELVNGSEHPIGSDFDLVVRSQSNIKHYPKADPAKQVKMAIAGITAAAVQSLKALAAAEPEQRFSIAMRRKAQVVSWQLISLSEEINIAELKQIAGILNGLDISAGNPALADASAQIDQIAVSLVGVEGSVTRSTSIGVSEVPPPPAEYNFNE